MKQILILLVLISLIGGALAIPSFNVKNITITTDGGITLPDATRIDGAEDLGGDLSAYATRSQLNATNATRINWTDVNTTLANPGQDTKLASEKAVRTAIEAIEVGDGADLSNVLNKTNPGSATGTLNLTSTETRNAFKIDQNAATSNSTSVGGAALVENTGNTGAGVVVYSNIGSTADGHLVNIRADNADFDRYALYATSDGTQPTAYFSSNGNGATTPALALTSTNNASSTLWVTGAELDHGTGKFSHNGDPEGDDEDAAIISLDALGIGTAVKGIYFTASTPNGGTSGDPLDIRNRIGNVNTKLINVSSSGKVQIWNDNLTMDSNYITGLHSPSLPTDAANKDYVDDAVLGATGGSNVTDSSANIALDDSENQFVLCGNSGANQTITLKDAATPDWSGKPVKFSVKTDPGANYVRIVATGGDLVGGGAVLRTTDYPASIEVASIGASYVVLNHEGSWVAGDA